jgi:hypothetical protein
MKIQKIEEKWRLRWLEDVENDVRVGGKGNNREEFASVVKEPLSE